LVNVILTQDVKDAELEMGYFAYSRYHGVPDHPIDFITCFPHNRIVQQGGEEFICVDGTQDEYFALDELYD
jgi:hypothetical protein